MERFSPFFCAVARGHLYDTFDPITFEPIQTTPTVLYTVLYYLWAASVCKPSL
jgi:hypothetical protein